LYRLGVRGFFRLDAIKCFRMTTMGDCGAFTYVNEPVPPFSPDQVIDFYEQCGFDLGISVDHVILQYRADADVDGDVDPAWLERQASTLRLAEQFAERRDARGCTFTPVGVAQGWSPRSYAAAVERLQEIGYTRLALGGMVPLKTEQILDCLQAIEEVREAGT